MNILLINHYAGSPEMGMEFRPYYLAREWIRMGHKVTIVAGDYSHLRQHNPAVSKDFQEELIDGINYCWVRTGTYEGNGAKRAFSMFRFVVKLMLCARECTRRWRPDIVIASSTYPLDTYAAQRICRVSGAKYIHEVHDMWPITLTEIGGMSESHPFVVLMGAAERSFCQHADKVVSLLPAADLHFISLGMQREAFHCITNGIVTEEWENPLPIPDDIEDSIERFKQGLDLCILFFGSHTRSYALDQLIDAIEINEHNVGAVFVGSGNYKEHLIKKANGDKKEKFLFLPPIQKRSIPSLLEKADVLYVGALKNDMFRFGISMNKLFDSMMAGKPILYAVEAPNNYIDEFNCGVTVVAEDVNALSKGIDQLADLSKQERNQLGINGKRAAINQFTYEKLAEQFEQVMISCHSTKD